MARDVGAARVARLPRFATGNGYKERVEAVSDPPASEASVMPIIFSVLHSEALRLQWRAVAWRGVAWRGPAPV